MYVLCAKLFLMLHAHSPSPGLNEYDVEGVWLVQRQVLWKIPKYLMDKMQGRPTRDSRKRQAWSIVADEDEEAGEVRERERECVCVWWWWGGG